MSKLRAAQKFGKELIDKANLATGLKVTKPGPATSRRVRKRGRNVNVAAGTAATGAVTAAATTRGTRKQQQKKGVKGDQAKDRSQQRKEQTMQRESALKRDREKTAQQTKSKKYNVGVSKGGVPFKEAFGYYRGKGQSEFTWNGKKYTTKLDAGKTATPASADASKADDSKKSVTRRGSSRRMSQRKFAGGGMMKAKGMAKGGKMMKKGYAMGGAAKKFPDLTGDGKVTQKDILKGRGVPGIKKGGAMTKKGYAMGGMAKKGYSKGGVARKGKPRGVGAALRGYGKALR